MKILEFHKRNTRNVILLFPLSIALKFPRFDLFKALISLYKILILYFNVNILKQCDTEGNLRWKITWILKGHYERDHPVRSISNLLFRGIMANWNERKFFLEDSNNPLLIQTYFSLFGLVNIQPIAIPIQQYSIGLYNKLCLIVDDKKELHNCDSHAWEDGNFTQREDGSIALYDYGSSRAWPLVKKYGRRFSKILQTT